MQSQLCVYERGSLSLSLGHEDREECGLMIFRARRCCSYRGIDDILRGSLGSLSAADSWLGFECEVNVVVIVELVGG